MVGKKEPRSFTYDQQILLKLFYRFITQGVYTGIALPNSANNSHKFILAFIVVSGSQTPTLLAHIHSAISLMIHVSQSASSLTKK